MASLSSKQSFTLAQNQLVKWINDAAMSESGRRADCLRKAVEILVHQCSSVLPQYMENILTYYNDKSTDVKKIIIAFIEELSKLHPQYLPKIIAQLRQLVSDSVIAVQKRAIQASSIVYRNTLVWICQGATETTEMQFVWKNLTELKLVVLNMIDSDNEGIRTHSIKFLEEVVLLQTPSDGAGDEFNLDTLPANMTFINRRALEEESETIFQLLVKFHNSQHISSVNLMACMTTLCLLAKFRPKFMPRVIQALGDLHTTLPPTLSQSQVNSVRKQLKMLLINLIKHPSSNDMIPQLTQLLLDIGMTTQEVNKVLPKEKRNKRVGEIKNGDAPAKRIRIDSPQSNSQGSDSNSNSRSDFNIFDDDLPPAVSAFPSVPKQTVIPTEDSLFEGLNNVEDVVNLVTHTLVNHLPNEMPSTFVNSYKPIPNSGTKTQKKNLAKMLLALINNKEEPVQVPVLPVPVPPAPALSEVASKIPLLRDDEEKVTLKNAVAKLQESTKAERQMESAVSKLMEETRQDHLKEEERKQKEKEKPIPPQTPTVPKLKQKVKLLKLQEITRPIPKEIKERLITQAVSRILKAETESVIGGAANIRAKFITIFASSYTPELRDLVLNYILEDPTNRIDLALSWLYEEYAFMQGFNRHPVTLQPKVHEKHDQNYNQLLCALITQISERGEPLIENSKDMLLRKVYSECPVVTDEAVDYLKHLVTEDKVALLALELLEELCLMRPPRAHKYVTSLLCHILNEAEEIRDVALKSTLKIFKRSTDAVRKVTEKHALLYLGFISLKHPPPELNDTRLGVRTMWSDELYLICLNLVMALLPENEELIIEVGRVYACAGAEARRAVLRAVEPAARAGGLCRALLDDCPRGAETLLTRLVHILTEKAPPSPELVSKVRELYATRVSDVRFLIPVLTGLSKKEILAALPKLIKLNPMVVKEVFNKLLGLQNPHEENSPVTPSELLVTLHLIDPSKADLKYIIKATALCFAEKQTYTQDVLSAVLQRLTEEPDIPVLMMRTVLQALTLYPNLGPLVLNILQLLIEKEVWLNKVAWEGWVKCCERLVPQSAVLLCELPARALSALGSAPRLQGALQTHVAQMPPHQRANLPHHIIAFCQQEIPPSFGNQIPVGAPMQGGLPMPGGMPMPVGVPAPVPPPNPMEPLPPGME